MKKVILLALLGLIFSLSNAQCLSCLDYDQCGSFDGYKIHYDPTTNRTCISLNKSGACSCKDAKVYSPTGIQNSTLDKHVVPVKKPILFQIDNINLLKYKVTVDGASENLGSDPGQLTNALVKVLGASIPGMDQAGGMFYAMDGGKSTPEKFTDCAECKSRVQEITKAIKIYSIKGVDVKERYGNAMDKCRDPKGMFKGDPVVKVYNDLNEALDLKIKIQAAQETFTSNTAKINAAYKKIKEYFDKMTICDHISQTAIKDLCDAMLELAKAINPGATSYSQEEFDTYVKQVLADFSAFKEGSNATVFKDFFSEGWQDAIQSKLDKFTEESKKMTESIKIIMNTGVPVFYRYNIPMIEADADRVTFMVSIEPRDQNNSSGYHIKNQPIRISTKGGVHFDYGIGIMIDGQRNPSYDLVNRSGFRRDSNGVIIKTPIGNDSVGFDGQYVVRKNYKARKPNVGISAQAFIMGRLGNYHYLGATIGAGFTSDLNGSLLVGLSYMWSTFPKVAISGGFALSTRREPTSFYKMDSLNESPVILPLGDHKIKYNIKVVPNWFVSISIGFGKVKESKIPSVEPAAATAVAATATATDSTVKK